MNMKDYFKTLSALKYRELAEDEVYNLICLNGFKLDLSLVKITRKDKKEIEVQDVATTKTRVCLREDYKKAWLLNKQM